MFEKLSIQMSSLKHAKMVILSAISHPDQKIQKMLHLSLKLVIFNVKKILTFKTFSVIFSALVTYSDVV